MLRETAERRDEYRRGNDLKNSGLVQEYESTAPRQSISGGNEAPACDGRPASNVTTTRYSWLKSRARMGRKCPHVLSLIKISVPKIEYTDQSFVVNKDVFSKMLTSFHKYFYFFSSMFQLFRNCLGLRRN